MDPLRLLHPRLTVLVTTKQPTKNPNIIAIAWLTPMSFTPRMVGIGVAHQRYSHSILRDTGEFVINVPTLDLASKVMWIGQHSGRDFDKFSQTELTPEPSVKVIPPRIKECIAWLECVVRSTVEVSDHTWFIGEVVAGDVRNGAFTNNRYSPNVSPLYYYLDGWFGALNNHPIFCPSK